MSQPNSALEFPDRKPHIVACLAQELAARPKQIEAAVDLLDGGATVPFIARYRKEATGGLDDDQLRNLQERLGYLRDLEDRRRTILSTISDQGNLTANLETEIWAAETKASLEDLYLPYKPKRRTKGRMAIEAGLEPLADALYRDPNQDPERLAAGFLNPEQGFDTAAAVLEGARFILMERFAEDAKLVGRLRDELWRHAYLKSKVRKGQDETGAKYRDYFDDTEPLNQVPSHRALAMLRGKREGILDLGLIAHRTLLEDAHAPCPCRRMIARHFKIEHRGRGADAFLEEVVDGTWKLKLSPRLETDLLGQLKEDAERVAIDVFARNLKELLMAPPAGSITTMGLDPGLRTGVKVAVVDSTGRLLDTTTVYPHAPKHQWTETKTELSTLCRRHGVALICIGNGTGGRETDRLVGELVREVREHQLAKIMVSEAGASVYSASKLAAAEFPDVDVSLRGAVSIARRVQDPLAELVKIDPKSIGVGQYQHDVNQTQLARSLDGVVEDCVNAVGVDLNQASEALLARVSGLNPGIARAIVAFRDSNRRFEHRKQLLKVPKLGPKTFELAAGFLRIRDGKEPLDASAVHPEAYVVVERMSKHLGIPTTDLIGNIQAIRSVDPKRFIDERFGLPTLRDMLSELEKPGRDPRGEFVMPHFDDAVCDMKDLKSGMVLEGQVTNVTNFGAFVDVGVHQDGLVHISQLAYRFVKDPHQVVKPGQIVKVKVLDVDIPRKRISLTMKLEDRKPSG